MQKENCDILQNLQRLKDMRNTDTPLLQVIATHTALLEENNKIRRIAAEKARHFFQDKYAWSPEWKAYKRPIQLWKLALKHFYRRVQGRLLRRLMNQCAEPTALTLTKDECRAN